MTPRWILDSFAAVMLAVAAASAARLALERPRRRGPAVAGTDVDLTHLLMGIAMAGLLAANLATVPDIAWSACFAAATAWFGWRVGLAARANGVRALAGHCAPHLVHSAAMLYMYLAVTSHAAAGNGTAGTGGSAGSAVQSLSMPTLAFAFALGLVGYSVWDIDQLSGRRYALTVATAGVTDAVRAPVTTRSATGKHARQPPGARAVLLAPAMTVACRVAMGVTMAFMLLIMI